MPFTSRRNFIINSGKAGISLYLSASALATHASGKPSGPSPLSTGFSQQPLPYSYDALKAAIDAQTMELHYSKHAAAYAKNLQEAASAEGVDTTKPLEDTLRKVSKYSAKLRNNGGGHYNHELFWKLMTPAAPQGPSGKLAAAITRDFGSLEGFKKEFETAGKDRFGSGWAWLVADKDGKLHIGSTPNQDNPLMDISTLKGFPVLGLDVWEHAYYLRYQNRRPDYMAAWWKVVNWDYAGQRYVVMG
jgi:Fe-Mn family superoxide dismutase